MIHEIRVSNFYSIRDEVVIDLRLARNAPALPRFPASHSRPDTRLPTVIAFIGPNAAGKSTILRALAATLNFAIASFDLNVDQDIPVFQPFMSTDMMQKPTRIVVEFDARWLDPDAPSLFRYELELENRPPTRKVVRYEALSHAPATGRRRAMKRLFERHADGKIYVAPEMGLKARDARLDSLRDNASVISTLAKLNVDLAQRIWTDLARTQVAASRHVLRTPAEFQPVLKHYLDYPEKLERLNRELRRFDVGIRRMVIERTASGPLALFDHDALDLPVVLTEESSGTQHFVGIFPALDFVLADGHIAVVDEFDSYFHPVLVAELMRWFQDPERNPHRAQLFVTVHNATVLDELEKPEIFLVEKQGGATQVYGAQDVQGLRRERRLLDKYLSGALGALPRIG